MAEKNIQNGGAQKDGGNLKESNQEDLAPELTCGFGRCRPRWLRTCTNSKILLVLLCAFCAIQSFVVNGVNNVNTTSYERRFGLPSSRVGIISSSYDISAGILVLPITYYGLRGHKIRMLTVGLISMAVGSFLMALPHFTTGEYEWGQNTTSLCSSANVTLCLQEETMLSNYLYLLVGGQLLHGSGGTTLYTIGIALIDDNVHSRSTPLYVGIMYAFAALGPAIGYVLGGYLLNIYVDFDTVDTQSLVLTTSDPRWVGAWWIGFILAMIMAIMLILPLLAVPRELPSAKEVRAARVSEAHSQGGDKAELSYSLKEAPKMLLSLLKNPTLVCVALSASSEGILVSGFATFAPKFIQNQFGRTASFSAIITGVMAVPGAAGGQIIGGYICRRFGLKVRGMLRLSMVTCLLCLPLMAVFWAFCPLESIAGVNTAYSSGTDEITAVNLLSECHSGCGCSQRSYAPVCGADGVQYFSPCHAGCLSSQTEKYSSCGCINTTFSGQNHSAESGACGEPCSLMNVFLPFFFLTLLLTFIAATPTTMVVLRCVPDSYKTFALGVHWTFARFLGTIPGPILFGTVIDNACILWKETCDNKSDSCWIYDNGVMSRNLFLISVAVKLLSTFFFFLGSLFYKAPPVTKGEHPTLELVSESKDGENKSLGRYTELDEDGNKKAVYETGEKEGHDNFGMTVLY